MTGALTKTESIIKTERVPMALGGTQSGVAFLFVDHKHEARRREREINEKRVYDQNVYLYLPDKLLLNVCFMEA